MGYHYTKLAKNSQPMGYHYTKLAKNSQPMGYQDRSWDQTSFG
jgi:hypothetical protein